MQACQRPALLTLMLVTPALTSQGAWLIQLTVNPQRNGSPHCVTAVRGGLILTPLLGCKARTPLDWTHAWAMQGEWAGKIAFPIPEDGKWPRHGHGIYLRPDYTHRTPPFLTWARPIFEQGALSPMSVFPADFPILCLPGDKLFQSKDVETAYCLPQ